MRAHRILSAPDGGAYVFDQQIEVSRIGRRSGKSEMLVEGRGCFVFCVDRQCANADNVRDLKRPAHGVEEKARAQPPSLHTGMNGEPREHEQRNRMARHAFRNPRGRCFGDCFRGDDRVIPDDRRVCERDIGLRRMRLLGLQRVADEEPVECRFAASEIFNGVFAPQLFDA